MLTFTPLNRDYRRVYEDLYHQCDEKTADTSFINLWAWQEKYDFEWSFADGLCWLRHPWKDDYAYYPPIGNWRRQDWPALIRKHFPTGGNMVKIPETLALLLKNDLDGEIEISEDRANWEYIYDVGRLISLSGPEYSTKRKLANRFCRDYNYNYKSISQEDIIRIEKFQQHWLTVETRGEKSEQSLRGENRAIRRLLQNWNLFEPELIGGFLEADNQIIAYTIGERIDKDMIMIHFEKALTVYKGAYQAVNRIFLENLGEPCKYVNREQDLGLPGLRKAKSEYHPVWFVKKYNLKILD